MAESSFSHALRFSTVASNISCAPSLSLRCCEIVKTSLRIKSTWGFNICLYASQACHHCSVVFTIALMSFLPSLLKTSLLVDLISHCLLPKRT